MENKKFLIWVFVLVFCSLGVFGYSNVIVVSTYAGDIGSDFSTRDTGNTFQVGDDTGGLNINYRAYIDFYLNNSLSQDIIQHPQKILSVTLNITTNTNSVVRTINLNIINMTNPSLGGYKNTATPNNDNDFLYRDIGNQPSGASTYSGQTGDYYTGFPIPATNGLSNLISLNGVAPTRIKHDISIDNNLNFSIGIIMNDEGVTDTVFSFNGIGSISPPILILSIENVSPQIIVSPNIT